MNPLAAQEVVPGSRRLFLDGAGHPVPLRRRQPVPDRSGGVRVGQDGGRSVRGNVGRERRAVT